MVQKSFPSLIVLAFSSLVMFNLAGCGGNSSNDTENATGNNEVEQTPSQLNLPPS